MRAHRVDTWKLYRPETTRERTRGLLDLDLGENEGLLLPRCRSVHTFGMRFVIDVVLLDREWRPVRVIAMRPGRLLLPRPRVRHVLEVAAGRGQAAAQEIHIPVPGALPVETQPSL